MQTSLIYKKEKENIISEVDKEVFCKKTFEKFRKKNAEKYLY